jgi:uroporphyrinogen decarboxylase
MNARERILAAIRHEPVDRVPSDIWATFEIWEMLYGHFGIDAGSVENSGANELGASKRFALYEALGIDGIFGIRPPYVGPPLLDKGDYHEDEWGIGSRPQRYATGIYNEQVHYPLAEAETIADLDLYRWPSPDWYDYDALPALAALYPDRAIECGYTAIFFWHNKLRGLERSLMDPLLRPEFTHELIRRLSDFFTEYHRRCYEVCGDLIQFTQVTDDFGSQHGLLISPQVFEAFYRTPIQRAIDLAKAYDLLVFHHDDGDMRPLLPNLVEMGIDVLNPIQWRCGDWDLSALKEMWGDRLCFHGGVDNQETLPHGTPAQVHDEVVRLIETLAADGTGFIMAPCHNLQPNTPLENILAMYEAIQTC